MATTFRLSNMRSGLDRVCIPIVPDSQNDAYIPTPGAAVLAAQSAWLLANHTRLNMPFGLHVGDHVQTNGNATEWAAAAAGFTPLEGHLNLIKAVGNHDYTNDWLRAATQMNAAYANDLTWLSGTMVPGDIKNSYYLTTASGRPVIVVSIEYAPPAAVLAWASSIFAAHPGAMGILLTHGFAFNDGTIYSGGMMWDPLGFAGDGLTGTDIESVVIVPNRNVRFVVSGHAFLSSVHWTKARPDGTKYHLVQMDFQQVLGGAILHTGYLCLLNLDFSGDTASTEVFSPYLNQYYSPGLPATHESNPYALFQDAQLYG